LAATGGRPQPIIATSRHIGRTIHNGFIKQTPYIGRPAGAGKRRK
jgi:hypothetical protein